MVHQEAFAGWKPALRKRRSQRGLAQRLGLLGARIAAAGAPSLEPDQQGGGRPVPDTLRPLWRARRARHQPRRVWCKPGSAESAPKGQCRGSRTKSANAVTAQARGRCGASGWRRHGSWPQGWRGLQAGRIGVASFWRQSLPPLDSAARRPVERAGRYPATALLRARPISHSPAISIGSDRIMPMVR